MSDLISREEVLTAFADYVGSGMSMDDYDALWNIVAKMPPVKQEPDPCDFCSIIYPDADTTDIVFGRGKYFGVHVESFITIDNEGKYHVNIDPGDPYELGYLVDIKFCPYCGRKLTESEDKE